MSVRRPHRASPARSSDWPRLRGATLAYTAAGALTARSGALALISRRRIRVEAILENIGQISVSVVTKHCQPPVTPSLGGDARVPRPGSRAWLPSSCAPPRSPAWRVRGERFEGARGALRFHFLGMRWWWGGQRRCGWAQGTPDGGPARCHATPESTAAAGRDGNNAVACSAACQARSPDPAFHAPRPNRRGPARRGERPLIWCWSEGGKVILGCLRRWVIGPRGLAAQGAAPRPVAGWRRRPRARVPPSWERPGGRGVRGGEGGGGDPTGTGTGAGRGAAEEGRRARKGDNTAFSVRRASFRNPRLGFGCGARAPRPCRCRCARAGAGGARASCAR